MSGVSNATRDVVDVYVAVYLYMRYWLSCVHVPYDEQKNIDDFKRWQEAHLKLNERQRQRAMLQYMEFGRAVLAQLEELNGP